MLAVLMSLVMLTAAAGSFAEPAEGTKTARLILQEIENLNGGPVTVHADNGKVTFIGGNCTAEPVKSFEDAKPVVDAALPLLGGDGRTVLEPWRVLNAPGGAVYYVFRQVQGDTLVPGGAVKVITDAEGNMTGLTGSVVPVTGEDAEEKGESITTEQAEELVLAHERELGRAVPDVIPGQTAKTVLPTVSEPDLESEDPLSRFVWAVYTTNPSADVSGTDLPYLAHYVTLGGEYLYSLPTIIPGDAAGKAGYDASYVFEFMEPAEYTGYVDYADGTEHEISVTLMRDTRTGMYYLGNIERKIVVADCWEFLYNGGRTVIEYSPDNREWDQTALMSLHNYCRAWDYYNAIGWNGGDGKQTPVIILKDYCDKDHNPVNNAAYAGRWYGWETFLSSSINDYAQCLDVAAHEFTHCVTHSVMTHNDYMNDYGAINEALSDIHGNLCEMMAGATADTDWLLGENSGQAIRSMSDPNAYGQPAYVWDICYRPGAKVPTATNDYGGVHTNSSLLNHLAYLLCTDGGMTPEEARNYWFAADCAMVPGSDYAQLRDLLPWVLKITGLDRYQDALTAAMDAVKLGQSGLPDPMEQDKALLVLNLPDNEVFNNGNWTLQFLSVNFDRITAVLDTLTEDFSSGNLDGYPALIRKAAEQAPAAKENRKSFLDRLLDAAGGILSAPETAPAEEKAREDQELAELLEWFRGKIGEITYADIGSAGPDGHTIRIMSRPGWTFPVLVYMAVNPGGAVIDQMKYVLFLNGRWFDLTAIINDLTDEEGKADTDEIASALLGSGMFEELVNVLSSLKNPLDLLKAVALDVKGGEIIEIPAENLEQTDLSTGFMNMNMSGSEEPNNRKSRPKLP